MVRTKEEKGELLQLKCHDCKRWENGPETMASPATLQQQFTNE
jgi:hypothetical protein